MKKVTLKLGEKSIHLELGHTYKEWAKQYATNKSLWGVLFEELIDGTLEPNEDIRYWYINGRCYETDEFVAEKNEPNMHQRGKYMFRYFFNAGLDKETLDCDLEGISVFEEHNGDYHFLADIPTSKTISDIEDMTDDEINEFLTENGIF